MYNLHATGHFLIFHMKISKFYEISGYGGNKSVSMQLIMSVNADLKWKVYHSGSCIILDDYFLNSKKERKQCFCEKMVPKTFIL